MSIDCNCSRWHAREIGKVNTATIGIRQGGLTFQSLLQTTLQVRSCANCVMRTASRVSGAIPRSGVQAGNPIGILYLHCTRCDQFPQTRRRGTCIMLKNGQRQVAYPPQSASARMVHPNRFLSGQHGICVLDTRSFQRPRLLDFISRMLRACHSWRSRRRAAGRIGVTPHAQQAWYTRHT